MMEKFDLDEDTPIENKMLTNAIEKAQMRVEERNFEIRKRLLDYDDVLNEERNYIYEQRDEILSSDDVKYGGGGVHNKTLRSKKGQMHGFEQTITLTLPPLSTIYFEVPEEKPVKKPAAKAGKAPKATKAAKPRTAKAAKTEKTAKTEKAPSKAAKKPAKGASTKAKAK